MDFLSNGNRGEPIFGFANFGESSWIRNGFANDKGIEIYNYSSLIWPDNSTGRATSYSQQTQLHCPAGMESTQTSQSPVIFGCTQCRVGFYKPNVGPEMCTECPDGTDCNDVGISVPCISRGFWRAIPSNDYNLGDFSLYPVFSCDIPEGCVSGCELSEICAVGRVATSVTCGVCEEGYYLNHRGKCLKCSADDVISRASVIAIYIFGISLLGSIYFIGIRMLADAEIKAINGFVTSRSSVKESFQLEVGDVDMRETNSRWTIRATVTTLKSNALHYISPQNFRDVMITSKIVLAFFQVMTAFFSLDLDNQMSSGLHEFFDSYNMNPFRGNEDLVACSSLSDDILPYYFIVLNCLFLPVFIMGLFWLITKAMYQYYRARLMRKCKAKSSLSMVSIPSSASSNQTERCTLTPAQNEMCSSLSIKIFSSLNRITLWLCLVFYPSICSIVLSVFNCRDFDRSGVWLRVDNEISCENASYKGYVAMASIGVVIYVVGIPILFAYAIYNRGKPLWQFSSKFLYHGFVDEWRYYEIVDLLRKLLITSVSQFVASPSSPTQVLFLLIVNCSFLYMLCSTTPYQHPKDNNLSTLFTSIECISFLFALLIVSGVSEEEGYDVNRMSNTLIVLFIVSILLVTPYTFMSKIEYFNQKFDSVKKDIKDFGTRHFPAGAEMLPDLSTLSSSGRKRASFMSEDESGDGERRSRTSTSTSVKEMQRSVLNKQTPGQCELSGKSDDYSVKNHKAVVSPLQYERHDT